MRLSRPPRSLASLLAFLLAGSALLLTAILLLAIGYVATREMKQTIGERVAERARYSALQLDASMYERYREVQNLAARAELAAAGAGARRAMLEQLQQTYPLYAWIGLTDVAGKVVASTGGLLEGADVTQRPWFADTPRRVRVHDLHDAKLLAALVPADAGAPQRFVDLAFPYAHADGTPAGVLGAHLSWRWAREMQAQFADPDNRAATTLIVSQAALVLSGPAPLVGSTVRYPSFAAAGLQAHGYVEETWADGKRYLVGYARSVGRDAYPGLGWVVLARQDLASAYQSLDQLRRHIALAGVVVASLFSLLGWQLARRITQPLLLAAQGALEIEHGQRDGLDAARPGYAELDKLIGAFNTLLARLGTKRALLDAANAQLEQRVAERTAELERSLAEVHGNALRIRAILETAQDAFVGMDLDGNITDWNPQAEQMFGWRQAEVTGRCLSEVIIPPAGRAAHQRGLAHFKRTGEQVVLRRRLLLTAMRRDGAEFPVEMTIGQVLVDGAISFGAFINDISERTRSAKALEAERLLLGAILETIDVAVVACDQHGALTLVNRFCREALGVTERAVPHSQWSAHYRLFEADGATPMAAERIPLLRALRGEAVIDAPLVIAPAGAAPRYLLCFGRQLVLADGEPLGAVVVMSDLTERQAAQRRLADSERFLRAVTDNLPVLIAYVDRDLRFQFANRAHETLFGLDPQAMIGRTLAEVLGSAVAQQMAPHVATVLAGRSVHVEATFTSRWPGYFISEYVPDLGPDGQVRGFHVMVMDISVRRAAELAAADSEVKALAASRAKSEFVANMSHEIRTPMNVVLGVTHLLLQTALTREQRELVEMVRTCGKSLVQIINDILDFSKIEAGKITIAAEPFSLAEIVDVVAIALRAKGQPGNAANLANVAYLLDVGPGLEQVYLGDALRLQQVLLNLVSNAVKFTERGSVTVTLRGTPTDAGHSVLQVTVRDTGIGISAEQQARLFGAFEQADSSTSRRFGGTGLGLTIARQLSELMGATLSMTSTPGEGSEFVFCVPLVVARQTGARALPAGVTRLSNNANNGRLDGDATGAGADNHGRADSADSSVNAAPVSLHGLRILLVEDNPLNQVVARGMLEPSGVLLTVAGNGQQALDCFRATPEGFDLVLMDVQMPVMDGFAATTALRRELGVRVPIIAMSAGVLETEQAQCRQVGMDDFIAKPVDYDQLMALLAAYAAAGRAAAAAPTAMPAPRIAGVIDLSVLLRFGAEGSPQRAALVQMLTRARDNAQADFARASAAIASGDAVAAARLLHSLRGGVGSLGAARFAAATLALEAALKDDVRAAAIAPLLARAADELDAVVAALAQWLRQP